MIRIATASGYTLVTHQEHARLAGRFAAHWGNAHFPSPAPAALLPELVLAVSSHDDAWAVRDATPFLTREGRPAAFTRELVGAYSAFEEIDLADYLAVRGGRHRGRGRRASFRGHPHFDAHRQLADRAGRPFHHRSGRSSFARRFHRRTTSPAARTYRRFADRTRDLRHR